MKRCARRMPLGMRAWGPAAACRRAHAPPLLPAPHPHSSRRGTRREQGCRPVDLRLGATPHRYDVVSLGNLCVDVVVQLEQLPAADTKARRGLLDKLMQSRVPEEDLEVGGNCNFILAASRLGLQVAAVGHTGRDQFGDFLVHVLQEDAGGCTVHQLTDGSDGAAPDATPVCFVLIDPASRHSFCSLYDFGPWPLLPSVGALAAGCLEVLRGTKALFANGFIFDELPFRIIHAAISEAAAGGAAVFFDPGPRCFTMQQGARREELQMLLLMTDVVLMTLEEAVSVTGETAPEAAASWVLRQAGSRTKWCVIKLGGDGSLAAGRRAAGGLETCSAPAYQVDVVDTVGCGDSFAAAVVLGYLQGQSLLSTLQLANAVGAATATGRGAGRNVATATQVFSLLEQQLGAAAPVEMLRSSLSTIDAADV